MAKSSVSARKAIERDMAAEHEKAFRPTVPLRVLQLAASAGREKMVVNVKFDADGNILFQLVNNWSATDQEWYNDDWYNINTCYEWDIKLLFDELERRQDARLERERLARVREDAVAKVKSMLTDEEIRVLGL